MRDSMQKMMTAQPVVDNLILLKALQQGLTEIGHILLFPVC
jgi:hypothetical protein